MKKDPSSSSPPTAANQRAFYAYLTGFGLSLGLTLAAYLLVVEDVLAGPRLVGAIAVLGVAQLAAQLFFFLHLGNERRPRWNLTVFLFMLLVVFILVAGSLWIMYNLNYHAPAPTETEQLLLENEGFGR